MEINQFIREFKPVMSIVMSPISKFCELHLVPSSISVNFWGCSEKCLRHSYGYKFGCIEFYKPIFFKPISNLFLYQENITSLLTKTEMRLFHEFMGKCHCPCPNHSSKSIIMWKWIPFERTSKISPFAFSLLLFNNFYLFIY